MTAVLTDKVIVVIGAAGLLGQQFCKAIAKNGGTVVVADRNLANANRVADEIAQEHPGKVSSLSMDITNKDSIIAAITQVHENHGAIDAIVNSAYPRNSGYGKRMEDVTYSDFSENVSMHLGGYFLVAQQFTDFFRKQGRGNIINMSSIYGVMAPRFEIYETTSMTMPVEYAVIKSGLLNLTRYMAKYLKGTRIRVNSISPGGIEDGQPIEFLQKYNAMCLNKGMLDQSDIVGTVLFLLSDASEYINGQNLIVDDGFSL